MIESDKAWRKIGTMNCTGGVVMKFKDKIENDIGFFSMEATVYLEFVNEECRKGC